MAMAYRFFVILYLVFAIGYSAGRNTVFASGDEIDIVGIHGRSLKVRLDDYGEASANTGHDPRNRGGISRSGGGRRTP